MLQHLIRILKQNFCGKRLGPGKTKLEVPVYRRRKFSILFIKRSSLVEVKIIQSSRQTFDAEQKRTNQTTAKNNNTSLRYSLT